MILTDTVDIINKTGGATHLSDVPAYFATMGSVISPGIYHDILEEQTRVLLEPDIFVNRHTHQIRWRGKIYDIDSDPIWHRQHGGDHHQTVVLKHVEG